MKGSERESRGADRPAPHADTFTPPPPTSRGGLGRQGVRWVGGEGGRGDKHRLLPATALFFLLQFSAGVDANGAAQSIFTVTHTQTPIYVFGSRKIEP